MKIREVTERNQELNEVFPLMAFVIPGIGMSVGATISTFFTLMSIPEIISFAEKMTGNNPEKITIWEWASVFFAITALKGPLKGLSKDAVKKITDAIPSAVKEKIGSMVQKKVTDEIKKGADNASDLYKPQPRRNRVDSIPSTKPAAPQPATPPSGAKAATPTQPAPAPKNPNLIDRPYQKEELLRLAGLAK